MTIQTLRNHVLSGASMIALAGMALGVANVPLARAATNVTSYSKPTVAFIGDSYTQPNVWPTQLGNAENWSVVDFAMGGTGYTHGVSQPSAPNACGLDYCPSFVEQARSAVSSKASIVVFAGGRNDGATDVTQGATEAFSLIRQGLPNAKIFVYEPFWDYKPYPDSLVTMGQQLQAAAKSVGGVTYLPLPKPYVLAGHPELFGPDGIHPNTDGYTVLAKSLEANWPHASVSATVFRDANRNGTNDNEAGAQGVTVSLYDVDGTQIGQGLTDSTGVVTFNRLQTLPAAGMAYTLAVTTPDGSTATTPVKVTAGQLGTNGASATVAFGLADAVTPPPAQAAVATVVARSSLVDGVGARMSLYLNGQKVGTQYVNSTTWASYQFPVPPTTDPNTVKADILFDNDEVKAKPAQDRNLFIQSLSGGGVTVYPSQAVFDAGTGYSAATDGRKVSAGTSAMWGDGALRWRSGVVAPAGR